MPRKDRRRGSVFLEFGLAFMIFMFALYGVMEFGRIVACYNILAGAAREGARYASVHGSSSGSAASATDVQTIVRNWCIGMDTSAVAVTTTWTPGNGPGGVVKVNASYTVNPFTGLILTTGMKVKSNAQLVISQ